MEWGLQRAKHQSPADTRKVQSEPDAGRTSGETNEKKIPEPLKSHLEPLNNGPKPTRFCVSEGTDTSHTKQQETMMILGKIKSVSYFRNTFIQYG